jgi:hypothetical protein
LHQALLGRVTAHHRFLLRQDLDQIGCLDSHIGDFDARIEE